jgi:hypothetical protein
MSSAPLAGDRRAPAARATAIALEQPPRRVAAVLFAGIALLCGLGALERLGLALGFFDFDGEGEPLAAFSALVLFAAGGLAVLTGWAEADRRARLSWAALGAFLVFMGLDEGATLHERLQSLFDVAWQEIYAPVIVVGGIAWLLVLRRVWGLARERNLMIGGAVAWFVAQVLESYQWSGPHHVHGYAVMSGLEETLEVTGSALFVMAMLGALRALHAARA